MALRKINWSVELTDYASLVLGEPFEWGRTDCASIVRNALRVMYGRDMLRGVGSWRTLTEAKRALEKIGSYEKFFKEKGCVEWSLPYRQRGDVAILPGDDRDGFPGLGIVMPRGILTVDEVVEIQTFEDDTIVMRFPNG